MDTKEMKIQVPAGYEIDKENSTLECIKFKPKKKATYEDIQNMLYETKKRKYAICYAEYGDRLFDWKPNYLDGLDDCVTKNQVLKLLAINKLMNVAKYLNEGWVPNWGNENDKYFIYYSPYGRTLSIDHTTCYNQGLVYFKSEELAKRAIEILGEGTIMLALSTDW